MTRIHYNCNNKRTPLPFRTARSGCVFFFYLWTFTESLGSMSYKKTYSKPPLTYQEQLDLLKSRGLIVEDEKKALHLLAHLSYYRFSAYLYPLLELPKTNHKFKSNATFDHAFMMYCFDRELKRLVFNEFEKIEISFRAQITYKYAHDEDPFWHTNQNLFFNKKIHSHTLQRINDSFNKSTTQFALAYKKKYSNPSAPSWIALETCDFGSLSMLYSNLRPDKTRRMVANSYGLRDTVLISWLHCLIVVRNICAHHGRLWNIHLNISPKIPTYTQHLWINTRHISNKRSYFILAMIRYMLFSINPSSTFTEKVLILLKKYPGISPSALGIPKNAFKQEFWKK